MIRTISITGRRGRYDLPTFLLTENEVLTLKFTGVDTRLGRYVATVRHGAETKTVYLSNAMTVDLTPEWLAKNAEKPLEVFLELRDSAGTRVLISSAKSATDQHGFYIEPLKLERVDDGWSMVAWLQRMENELVKLEKRFDGELKKALGRIEKAEKKLSQYEDQGVPLLFED